MGSGLSRVDAVFVMSIGGTGGFGTGWAVSRGVGCTCSGGLGGGGGGSIGILVASIGVMISGTVPLTVSPAKRIAPMAA